MEEHDMWGTYRSAEKVELSRVFEPFCIYFTSHGNIVKVEGGRREWLDLCFRNLVYITRWGMDWIMASEYRSICLEAQTVVQRRKDWCLNRVECQWRWKVKDLRCSNIWWYQLLCEAIITILYLKKSSLQRLNDHSVFPESIRKRVRIIAQIVSLSLEGLQILEGGFLN